MSRALFEVDMTTPAIQTDALGRTFRRKGAEPVLALDNTHLVVPQGSMHGLLGPNGAGKTTLTKVLATILHPTSGRAEVLGMDVVTHGARIRPLIGLALGGERGLYSRASVRQNMLFWGALHNLPGREARARCDQLLERFGLEGKAKVRVEELSRGMKQRIHLAKSLIGDPRVLFLDEPSSGLDPVAARDLRGLLASLKDEGRTILLSTHDMAEAETLCDEVSLIDHGRILVTASASDLVRMVPHNRVDFKSVDSAIADQAARIMGVRTVIALGADRWRVVPESEETIPQILHLLVERGVMDVSTQQPTLEEAYVGIIGDRGARL